MPLRLALLATIGLATAGCAAALPAVDPLAPTPGDHDEAVEHEGRRTYMLHVPPSHDDRRAWPLLVVLHGAFADDRSTEDLTDFSGIADREGFVVAYPNATSRPAGLFQLWNAGHCCGKQVHDKVDDLGFIGAVLDDVQEKVNVDPKRVFVEGYSNGGMLAFLVGARYADRVAAVGVFAGNMSAHGSLESPEIEAAPPSRPVSMILVQGTLDTHVAYQGEIHDDYVEVPFDATGRFWARADRCAGEQRETQLFADTVQERTFSPCAEGTEVRLLSIDGWKHEWPSRKRMQKLADDDPRRGFDVAEIIWAFLASHPRRGR